MICHSADKRIIIDDEIVCGGCGVVYEQSLQDMAVSSSYSSSSLPPSSHANISAAAAHSRMSMHEESKVGSRRIICNALPLIHLNKKRTEYIIQNNDKYLDDFMKICDSLRLPKPTREQAYHTFRGLRNEKCGNANLAVFAIYDACICAGTVVDEANLLNTVRVMFSLKRRTTLSKAIYKIKPLAVERGFAKQDVDDSKYLLRKYVSPRNYAKAVRIRDIFVGTAPRKARKTERIINAYV